MSIKIHQWLSSVTSCGSHPPLEKHMHGVPASRQYFNIFFHISVIINPTHAQPSAVTARGKDWQTGEDQHASTCLINSFSLARFYIS